LAVCELVFIALLNEIVHSSAGWCLHTQNSDQKNLRLCINVIVVISWPHRRIRDDYHHHAEDCE
jgi:hypothetical protein